MQKGFKYQRQIAGCDGRFAQIFVNLPNFLSARSSVNVNLYYI